MMMMLLLSMLSVAEMDPQTSIRINVATVAFTSAALAHYGALVAARVRNGPARGK